MTIIIDTPSDLMQQVEQAAAAQNMSVQEYTLRALRAMLPEAATEQYLTAQELLRLPRAERSRYLAAAAEKAAPVYAEDLAKPVHERELTAFTALDGEPFLDYE